MIFRVNKTTDYTVVCNYHLKDSRLSLKAKGLLTIMLSLSEDWNYSIKGLMSICIESETAITTALNELKKFGYVIVKKILPNESESKKIEYEYNIYEIPQNQGVEVQGVEVQGVENHPLDLEQKEKYTKEKDILTNNILTDNNILTNNNILSIEEKRNYNKEKRNDRENQEKWFGKLWEIYPRKVSKMNAYSSYLKKIKGCNYEEAYKKTIGIYKLLQKNIALWEEEKRALEYIPYFSSWLNANIPNKK